MQPEESPYPVAHQDPPLEPAPIATTLVSVLVFIVAIVGGVVLIVGKSSLNFQEYVTAVTGLAVASGLLGIGRGIAAAAKKR
jgi:hypothetical protein